MAENINFNLFAFLLALLCLILDATYLFIEFSTCLWNYVIQQFRSSFNARVRAWSLINFLALIFDTHLFFFLLYRVVLLKRWCYAAPWARATKNVNKPLSQMCESCRKAWFKIFVKQNRNIFGFSHTFDSEVCYCSK